MSRCSWSLEHTLWRCFWRPTTSFTTIIGRQFTRYVAELVPCATSWILLYIILQNYFSFLKLLFGFSFLVNLLYLLSMKTNILLLTGMCDHKYPTARKSLDCVVYLSGAIFRMRRADKGLRNLTIFYTLG